MDKLLIARLILEQKSQLELIVVLGFAVIGLIATCYTLWRRLDDTETAFRELRAAVNGQLDGMGDHVSVLYGRTVPTVSEMNTEVDEILEEPLPTRAVPPPLPTPAEATITPIGKGAEIRKTSARPPGKPPRRPLGAPKAVQRLERPGLRPQEKRGPFTGKPPGNPFDDS